MRQFNSKNLNTPVIDSQTIILMLRVPLHQLQLHIDDLFLANGGNPVEILDIDDSQAANLHEVLDGFFGLTDQSRRHLLFDKNHIIRNQSVSANNKIQCAFTLADSAFPGQQNTHPENINQNPMHVGCRQKPLFQKFGNQRYKGGRLMVGVHDRNTGLFGMIQQERGGDQSLGYDETGYGK